MMIVALLGGKKEELYKPLVNMLASSGYRVSSAVYLKKVNIPSELKKLAEAGAGITLAYSTNRLIYTTTFVPDNLEDIKKRISCLSPVEPDVLVLLGFQKLVSDRRDVLKALSVWSVKEANSLISEQSPPIVGVYSERQDFPDGYNSPVELAKAIIEEGRRRSVLPPLPKRV